MVKCDFCSSAIGHITIQSCPQTHSNSGASFDMIGSKFVNIFGEINLQMIYLELYLN